MTFVRLTVNSCVGSIGGIRDSGSVTGLRQSSAKCRSGHGFWTICGVVVPTALLRLNYDGSEAGHSPINLFNNYITSSNSGFNHSSTFISCLNSCSDFPQ